MARLAKVGFRVHGRRKTVKKMIAVAAAVFAAAIEAQVLTPYSGVANDHGYGPTAPVNVAYAPRTVETGYGYGGGQTFLSVTILPWSAPGESWDVRGLRLNLGWGANREMYGIDAGLFGWSDVFAGIGVNVFGNYTEHDADGIQIGLINEVDGRMRGIQIGLVNSCEVQNSLNIGLVNIAERLEGVQIGLLNFNRCGIDMPILNAGW